ncbi:hypothetical protein GE300_02660 [Rhodobacteraceae bacterium 2CG4]|uniref:Glycosyltransferase RgtA/B/C/D-like domain-containing protein n=2 Tax=Halovulum marinum TaxID=2662447 RepID=A0A6L5YX48_9RHOB|nr:hypothetical protein [Halovulum marinum]
MQAVSARLARTDWLTLGAALGAALALGVLLLGWNRAFWYDEVFTLGAAAAGRPLDWDVLLRDVHPPTYVLLVRGLGAALGGDSPLLRLVNLPGLLALLAALAILSRHLDRPRLALLAALIAVNGYTLGLMLDLRSYFLLLGLATLGHALLLDDAAGRPRTAALALNAAALSALHFFGAAIGLALLLLSTLQHWRAGRRARAAASAALGAAITAGVLLWAFGIARTADSMGGRLWITNDPGPFLDFAAQQIPLALLALGIAAAGGRLAPGAARAALVAPALVLAAGLLIALHTPVISTRNLVVGVPGVTLAAVLSTPQALLDRLRATPLTALVLLLAGLRYGDIATQDAQMIRWAVTEATPPECDGVPLYVKRPDIVDEMAQQVFRGSVRRPLEDFSAFERTAPRPPDCTVLAMGWHELGRVALVTDYFADHDVATEAVLPPDPRLARRGLMTHGFVIRATPETSP